MKKITVTLVYLALSFGWAQVTIKREGGDKLTSKPTYEESLNYYFWGASHPHHIEIQKVCNGQPAIQIQSRFDPMDVLLGVITIGIYTPRTAKIWCGEKT